MAAVLAENTRLIELGGFHENLVFRQGDAFVTLVRDPDSDQVRVKVMDDDHLGMLLSEHFCFIAPKKDDENFHKPLPGWFTKTIDRYMGDSVPKLAWPARTTPPFTSTAPS